MVYELEDVSRAAGLFDGWNETLIWSCLEKVMGKIYVTDLESPRSAMAFVGCFAFFAGEPERELVLHKPEGFGIMTPQNDDWAKLIEECYPARKEADGGNAEKAETPEIDAGNRTDAGDAEKAETLEDDAGNRTDAGDAEKVETGVGEEADDGNVEKMEKVETGVGKMGQQAHGPVAKRVTRYAIRKDTKFDTEKLQRFAAALPEGYVLRKIDAEVYDLCLKEPQMVDFVSSFENKEQFLEWGRGVVVLKRAGDSVQGSEISAEERDSSVQGSETSVKYKSGMASECDDWRVVAGASSYIRYQEVIEIEVDTLPEERRKGLATSACAALILQCLEEGLYPSWDAQNLNSVHLAEKLGYEFDHEYAAYEVV